MNILIEDSRCSIRRWAARTATSAIFIFAPIAVGVYLDSGAMQWVGFLFGFIILASYAIRATKDDLKVARSYDEARRIIDELERAALSKARGETT